MFDLKSKSMKLAPQFVGLVTIIVLMSACAQTHTRLVDNDEKRVIPVSEFETGGSWKENYHAPTTYTASREDFKKRVKKTTTGSRKSSVASSN